METCTVETGLLRKSACGHTAVTSCANCEQPLCSKHAIAQLNAGRKTGKFLCADCNAADRQYQETQPVAAATAPKPAAQPPAAPPASPAAAKPPAAEPKAEAAKPEAAKPEAAKPEAAKPEENSDGSIDFTPSKK